MGIEPVLIIIGVLLLLSVVSSKASARLGIPALVLFLAIGMLAGSEGFGGIYFDDPVFANRLGIMALVFILFAGGFDTQWRHLRPILWPGIALATIGVAATAGFVALFAHYCLNFDWREAALLGAIVSSTDAAAVFSILRVQSLRLKGHLGPLLELESGSNDPMAIFLTVGLTEYVLHPERGFAHFGPELGLEILLGTLGGLAIGKLSFHLINRIHLDYDGLYPVVTVAIALLSYAGIQAIGGSGFLAAYLTAVTLGSGNFVHRLGLIQFHEGLSWLMQIAMFLCLGLLVFPSELFVDAWRSIGIALFLMLVARPLAVGLSLLPFKSISWKETAFVGWVGLRGAVPIVLATIPLVAGFPGAERVFNCVFFIVLLSVLFQGMTIRPLAHYLGVAATDAPVVNEKKVAGEVIEVTVPKTSHVVGRSVVELALPESLLLILLTRGSESLIPRGSTVIRENDHVLVYGIGDAEEVRAFFARSTPP